MKKLAIVTTHPIQYYAPVFQLLEQRKNISLKVFYTWGENSVTKYDPGFGKTLKWDLPLLEGYDFEWVVNSAKQPGSHHFKGIVNPDLNKKLKQLKPDAILVIGWSYDSHLKVLRYFKGKIPIYFRGDSTLLDDKGGLRSILKRIYLKWVYGHIDHAFYVGSHNNAYFKRYGLKENQLSFAPHAIDNERFGTGKSIEALALRNELGLSPGNVLVLFAGKFEEKKNPLLLIEAFLAADLANCHLLLVGNGVLERQLKEKANGSSRIHFKDLQNQSRMPVIYQACDLFCLPSKGPGETWGLAINEAMACGKAILASDKVGCATDLVRDQFNGAVFSSADAGDLLQKLSNLVNSSATLTKYGDHSLNHIQDWNFINIASAIERKIRDEKKRQD